MKHYKASAIVRPQEIKDADFEILINNLCQTAAREILRECVTRHSEEVGGFVVTTFSIDVVVSTPAEIESYVRKEADRFRLTPFAMGTSTIEDIRGNDGDHG